MSRADSILIGSLTMHSTSQICLNSYNYSDSTLDILLWGVMSRKEEVWKVSSYVYLIYFQEKLFGKHNTKCSQIFPGYSMPIIWKQIFCNLFIFISDYFILTVRVKNMLSRLLFDNNWLLSSQALTPRFDCIVIKDQIDKQTITLVVSYSNTTLQVLTH